MLEDKQKNTMVWKAVCVLAALMIGAFLGSPASKGFTGQISEAISGITIQAVKMQYIHKEDTAPEKQLKADQEIKTGEKSNTTDATSKPSVQETEEKSEPNADAASIENTASAGITETAAAVSPAPAFSTPANEDAAGLVTNANRGGAASRKEVDVLIHLINAEAYGLSYKAKVAVGQVVMNRWTGPYYGDDLLAIMTAPHQFTPIYNGSAYKKKIEQDSVTAAYAVLSGTGVAELTDDTYYFVNPDFTQDKTIETKMQFVCEIEGMHFFKPPAK
ncbi:cell wall hydrolase [Anoxybacterium hadale]|uniref:cell wall hydrolase n=1 Tax=Anoxybacterium hadale TaxID=3408580 RepID=UPI003B009102